MTLHEALFVFLGAAAGGFINGMAAFGTALFALGFFLTVMNPVQAVALCVSVAALSGLQGSWYVRHEIGSNLPRLARFVLPGLVGVPLGLSLLSLINTSALKLLIAVFLILYGTYFSLRASLPRLAQTRPLSDCVVGFLGGVLGGAAALSGVLPTMWCSLRSWPKAELRAVLQPYNLSILSLTLIMLVRNGVFAGQTLIFLALALPVALIFSRVGITLYRHIPDGIFQRILIVLCLISGAGLLLRELQ